MEIDIISYTDEQFASMTDEQILEVENVQLKKNRLTERLKEKKRGEKFRLLKAGVFRSGIWENICAALEPRGGKPQGRTVVLSALRL